MIKAPMKNLSNAILFSIFLLLVEPVAPALSQAQEQTKKPPAKEEDCGCDSKAPTDVAAMVNGAKVTFKDVDDPIKDRLTELQKQVSSARSDALNREIAARLFQSEARRRGITVDKLEAEINARAQEPTEADARAYYDQNKQQIEGEYETVRTSIIGWLRSQRQQEAMKKEAERLQPAAKLRVVTPNPTQAKTEADRAKVLAILNAANITAGEIEDAAKPALHDLQQQIYALRKQSLDAKINTMLLDEEARRRNQRSEDVFQAEVSGLIQPVREQDARKFYEENRERISGGYIQVRQQIVEYLEGQEQQRASAAFAEKLRSAAKIQNYLTEPEGPFYRIAIDDQPTKGNPNAPVTIIEFTDFQCPSCGRTQPIIEQVVHEMGDKVRLVVRDFPLDQHQFAQKAAEAAEAARAQGKYWEYTAILFKNQNELGVPKLKEYAGQIGLDQARFDRELDSGQYAALVKRDLRDGGTIGVSSTPSIYVNGRKVQDKTAEGLKAAVEAALKKAPARTAETPKKQTAGRKQ
jgi:protein-disulfide isomerase